MDIDAIDLYFEGNGTQVSWGGTVDVRFPTGEKFRFQFENDTEMTPLLAQLQEVIKKRARQRLQDWQSGL